MTTPAEHGCCSPSPASGLAHRRASHPWEWQALDRRARALLATGELPPHVSELFLQVVGEAVVNHGLPANIATNMLDTVQKTITNIGSVLSHEEKGKPSSGVLKRTRFYVTPIVMPGSIVFHLDRDPESAEDNTGQAPALRCERASARAVGR